MTFPTDFPPSFIHHNTDIGLSKDKLAGSLSIEKMLTDLADHLPEKLKLPDGTLLPFSGAIAFQAGETPIVQASHCPSQAEFQADRPFNCLSIGKLFTAVAVMQLIDEGKGKFSLDSTLRDLLTAEEQNLTLKPPYLEQKPTSEALKNLMDHADKITLGHLLSHTAGFQERPASKVDGTAEGETWSADQVGKYQYSNYGYQLLARIIGKHSPNGDSSDHEVGFRNHIEMRIFKPSAMEGAISEIHAPDRKNEPDYFEVAKNGEKKKVSKEVVAQEPYPHGNGCWRMKPSDLLAFGKSLQQNSLISEESIKAMLEHDPPLGFFVDRDLESETKPVIGYGHPGGGPGMSAFLHTWLGDPPITGTVLSNYTGCEQVKPLLDPIIYQRDK